MTARKPTNTPSKSSNGGLPYSQERRTVPPTDTRAGYHPPKKYCCRKNQRRGTGGSGCQVPVTPPAASRAVDHLVQQHQPRFRCVVVDQSSWLTAPGDQLPYQRPQPVPPPLRVQAPSHVLGGQHRQLHPRHQVQCEHRQVRPGLVCLEREEQQLG